MRDTSPSVAVSFAPRPVSLVAVAVVGLDGCALALARRLCSCPDDELAALRGVAGPGLLALEGPHSALPWVDGVVYLGRDDAAPRLLLPTTLTPSVAAWLLEAALLREHGGDAQAPFAVLARPRLVFSMAAARQVRRANLVAWLEAQR